MDRTSVTSTNDQPGSVVHNNHVLVCSLCRKVVLLAVNTFRTLHVQMRFPATMSQTR